MNETIKKFIDENGHVGLFCLVPGRGAVAVEEADGVLREKGGAAVAVGERVEEVEGLGVAWPGHLLSCGNPRCAAGLAEALESVCGRRDLVLILERRINGFTDRVDVRLAGLRRLEDPDGNPVEGAYLVYGGEGVDAWEMAVPFHAETERLGGHMVFWVSTIRDPYRWWAKLVIPNER